MELSIAYRGALLIIAMVFLLSADVIPPAQGIRSRSQAQNATDLAGSSHQHHLHSLRNASRTTGRRELSYGYDSSSSSYTNSIDECWRGDASWADNRMKLADCGIGFGSRATGGKGGEYYVVTDPSDDAVNPVPGTLRYGVTRMTPLWIYFAHDMSIVLENELIIASDKTIDGRGANVQISHGPCLTIQYVTNVIVHGLNIHHCTPGTPGRVMSSAVHVGYRQGSDGDGISLFGAQNIWIDHNSLSSCADGLIDAIRGSTAITISNNAFTDHDKVMLLGHNDAYTEDKGMRVTVAFNRFGPGLVQRMPRCRFGFFHIVNNDYQDWSMYAIGGSADPTIISEGNRFLAAATKEVTKRDCNGDWQGWTWKSIDDTFLNGAYFVESGPMINKENRYGLGVSSKYTQSMTSDSGSLSCMEGKAC